MTQVIYKIVNLVNDKFYVGSTVNKKVRFRQHRRLLRGNRHHCAHLQAAWNKYGEQKFAFVEVETVPEGESLQAVEDRYLQACVGTQECYNTGRSSAAPWRGAAGAEMHNFGKAMASEQKQKISEALKAFYAEDYFNHPRVGKKHSAETRAKISASKKANPQKPWAGKARDEETRKKIGDAQRGVPKSPRVLTEEGRLKIKQNIAEGRSHRHWLGRKHTEEARLKMGRPVCAKRGEEERVYTSLTALRNAFGITPPTLDRALKSGRPITKGAYKGWEFKYVDAAVHQWYNQLNRNSGASDRSG